MTGRAVSPRLLVSVRSADEARSALEGGADIIDVKDPHRGSLGRADASVIAELATGKEFVDSQIPLSVALGEVQEWNESDELDLPGNVTFAKLGLAGLQRDADWTARWTRARESSERRTAAPIGWIAVIYADAANAGSPPAQQVLEAAAATTCAGVL
ncbi:MAG: hypothetical protein KF861_18195, partial [Planctomycetaceae bacterium]|nr:hypothetical protein [Planctomycetaceae bacterium]